MEAAIFPPVSAVDAVTGRRSVRAFLPAAVNDELVRAILAGAWAIGASALSRAM